MASASDNPPVNADLGRVLGQLSQPVCVRNFDRRIVFANRAFCDLIGVDAPGLEGLSEWPSGTNPTTANGNHGPASSLDAFAAIRANDERALARRIELGLDTEWVPTFQGALREVSSWRSLLGNDTSTRALLWLLAVPNDDAALSDEALESRLQARESELRSAQYATLEKERLVLLGRLASGIAHQIRNPLGAISNALAVLRRQLEPAPSATVAQALEIAEEEVWVANRIITDLLDYARTRPARPSRVALDDILSAALTSMPLPEAVSIGNELGGDILYVDEDQVRDAIVKLVRNALEAMNGEGTITFHSVSEGEYCRLTISDTGVGLVRGSRALLFEPLITNKPMGLGLGLATAKTLVENQGGRLEADESDGPGARFTMWLPAHRGDALEHG